VYENHFVSIANPAANHPTSVHTFHHRRTLFSKQLKHAGSRGHKAGCRILGQNQRMTQVYKSSEEPIFQELSPTVLTDADPLKVQDMTTQVQQTNSTKGTRQAYLSLADTKNTREPTGFQTFPLNNFKYFLTLFSKFFSSFPHGTCSLSVSSRYLALDEIYHPFSAALPSYTTL
jgi:hypothetical protein